MKDFSGEFSVERYENEVLEIGATDCCQVSEIGRSIFGRKLYSVSLGKGDRDICLVGGVRGRAADAQLLLTFIKEFCKMYREERRVYNTDPMYVLSYRRLIIIPLLDPDGAVYRSEGVSDDNVLRDRLIAMNCGNEDFSEWEANGRGVSLERNVPIGFPERKRYEEANEIYGSPSSFSGQTPVSEPELCALYSVLCKEREISLFADISTGSPSSVRGSFANDKKGKRIGESIARIGGLKYKRELRADDIGIADWIGDIHHCPSFSLSLGSTDYENARELLYTLPLLI